jgi:glycerol-3-phosphate dehydrogenase
LSSDIEQILPDYCRRLEKAAQGCWQMASDLAPDGKEEGMAPPQVVDLLVVGGGVNGAGIARDAAGRGLSVILAEQGDLAGGTSSSSSKLIHGGLRYLEHYEFRLVREALQEREVLLRIAPHIAWPMRFVLPHSREQRPAWMLRLGLFLYDHLGGRRSLPGTRRLDLRRDATGAPIRPEFRTAFAYSDAWVDDSRLVALNAMGAREHGAEILTRTRCLSARREDGLWRAELETRDSGLRRVVQARALVNAAGPWVADVLNARAGLNTQKRPRLVKGSHIIVPRLYDGEHAFILQNDDRRVIFVIPYENGFSLIGTTDIPFEDDPATVAISTDEVAYLCRAVSRYFAVPLTPDQVVHSYSGVRPLYDDAAAEASAVTRDYVLDLDVSAGQAPILSVFGGKITTYRRLAEHALEKLLPYLAVPHPASWTATVPLPGGEMPQGFDAFLAALQAAHPWLSPDMARRLAHAYGTHCDSILGGARGMSDLGEDFGAGLTEAELIYLVRQEWAHDAEDVLWRRSKLGLHLDAAQRAHVAVAMARLVAAQAAAAEQAGDMARAHG